MNNQKEKSEILLKATGQGFSIAIHGKKDTDGSWKCSVERNEIVFADLQNSDHVNTLEEQRYHDVSDFKFSFEEAFRKFDQSEWYLCHPAKINPEFADFVIKAFDKRMEEYNQEFLADTPMERFIRKNKVKEWQTKANVPQPNEP